MQKCWLVLGRLWYHYEATDFLNPITAEDFGQEMYDDYCSVIANPMDISTIKERCRSNYYIEECDGNNILAKELFKKDVLTIF